MKLISEFQSVDNLLAQVDKLKGSIKEKVENSRDRILLSRELARICTQVPVVFDEQDCRVSEPDRARLREWFVRLGFRSFLSRLDSQSSSRGLVSCRRAPRMRPL
jgi:DNA polymerase-1